MVKRLPFGHVDIDDSNYLVTGERGTTNPLAKALVDAFFKADELTQQMITKLLGIDLASIQNANQGNVGDNNIINSPGSGNPLKIRIDKKRDK